MNSSEDITSQGPPAKKVKTCELEQIEEEKLKAKYEASGIRAPVGHSAFLLKRLQKGQKYFDSGDYQMAKQSAGEVKQLPANKISTIDLISTFNCSKQ